MSDTLPEYRRVTLSGGSTFTFYHLKNKAFGNVTHGVRGTLSQLHSKTKSRRQRKEVVPRRVTSIF